MRGEQLPGVRACVVVVIAAALAVAWVVPAGAHSPEEERVAETRAKISQVRGAIEQAKSEAATDAAAYKEAEAQLAQVLEAVGQAEQAAQRQHQAVEQARTELEGLQEQATYRRQVIRNRAVELYKQGSSMPVDVLLAAESPEDALRRSSFIDIVATADRRNLEGVSAASVAVDAQREVLKEEEASLERVLAEQRAIYAEVEEIRNDRALVFAASADQVAQLQAQESHLEAESRELAALARRASRQAAADAASRSSRAAGGGGPVAVSSGGWTWPVRGPVTSGYGPRWGRMHQGVDIGASTGTAIHAARAGVVTHTGSMGGYGQMTLIDHGGGIVTAYAHQSAIAVRPGARVDAGQRIGSVGCTGSCTGPHLHFEVRVNGGPRNPRNYLP